MKLSLAVCISSCLGSPIQTPTQIQLDKAVKMVKEGLRSFHGHQHEHADGKDHLHLHEHSERVLSHDDHENEPIPQTKEEVTKATELIDDGMRLFHSHEHQHKDEPVHHHLHEHSEKISTHDDHDYEYEEMPGPQGLLPDVAFLNHETAVELLNAGASLIHEHPHDHEDTEEEHAHAHEHSQRVPNHENHIHQVTPAEIVAAPVSVIQPFKRLSPLSPPVTPVKPVTPVQTAAVSEIQPFQRLSPLSPPVTQVEIVAAPVSVIQPFKRLSPHSPPVTPVQIVAVPVSVIQPFKRLSLYSPPVTPVKPVFLTETIISTGQVHPAIAPMPKDAYSANKYDRFVPPEILLGERDHFSETGHLVHVDGHQSTPWESVPATGY